VTKTIFLFSRKVKLSQPARLTSYNLSLTQFRINSKWSFRLRVYRDVRPFSSKPVHARRVPPPGPRGPSACNNIPFARTTIMRAQTINVRARAYGVQPPPAGDYPLCSATWTVSLSIPSRPPGFSFARIPRVSPRVAITASHVARDNNKEG
jgi:hypothetical protein